MAWAVLIMARFTLAAPSRSEDIALYFVRLSLGSINHCQPDWRMVIKKRHQDWRTQNETVGLHLEVIDHTHKRVCPSNLDSLGDKYRDSNLKTKKKKKHTIFCRGDVYPLKAFVHLRL